MSSTNLGAFVCAAFRGLGACAPCVCVCCKSCSKVSHRPDSYLQRGRPRHWAWLFPHVCLSSPPHCLPLFPSQPGHWYLPGLSHPNGPEDTWVVGNLAWTFVPQLSVHMHLLCPGVLGTEVSVCYPAGEGLVPARLPGFSLPLMGTHWWHRGSKSKTVSPQEPHQ